MAEFPAIPLWTDALLGDTTHLSAAEFGAYMLMLITAWRSPDCDLPNDDKYLSKVCRLPPMMWRQSKSVLLEFWDTDDAGRLHQKRLSAERKYVSAVVEKRRAAGASGGRAKALRNGDVSVANASNLLEQTPSKPLAPTPTPTPFKKEWHSPNGRKEDVGQYRVPPAGSVEADRKVRAKCIAETGRQMISVSDHEAREMVRTGLLTAEQAQKAGYRI